MGVEVKREHDVPVLPVTELKRLVPAQSSVLPAKVPGIGLNLSNPFIIIERVIVIVIINVNFPSLFGGDDFSLLRRIIF
jgi:hypothetical protein